MRDILLELLLDLLLESSDISFRGNFEALFECVDLEVLLLGELDKTFPVVLDLVDLVLMLLELFLLEIVLVHLEDAELLNDLCNLQLHIHGVLADIVDDVQQVLDRVDPLNITLQLLIVGLCLVDNSDEIPDGNVGKDFAQRVEPELHLCIGTINDLLVVNEDEVVLNLRLLLLDVHTLEHLEANDSGLNVFNAA